MTAKPITFQQLLHEGEDYLGQEVAVRGFLYRQNEQLILAEQPNLKSCCIGNKKNQLLISGMFPEEFSSFAQLIQGQLIKNHSSYMLVEAFSVQEEASFVPIFAVIGIFFILYFVKIIKKD